MTAPALTMRHGDLKAPRSTARPAIAPVAADTAAKGSAVGLTRPHATDETAPVVRPAAGPVRAAMRTVPTESR